MTDRDLKLNTLSRYRKNSPQFILEAHGHCEVPAGCGGVVLRWWNPSQGIPVEMWVYTSGESAFWLDGKPAESGCPLVSFGKHVLGFRIATAERAQGILMFAGLYDETGKNAGVSRKTGTSFSLVSAAGDGWKYTLSDPGEDAWMHAEFDDSKWRDMVEAPVPKPEKWNHQYTRLSGLKAKGMTVGPQTFLSRIFSRHQSADTVWVRKAFSL